MKRAGFAILLGTAFAAVTVAQTPTTAQAPPSNAPTQAEPTAPALPSGPAVNAQLNSSVDSKKAKVGDKVEAHATDDLISDGKTIVPKGAKLEGHVTEATARSKGDGGSTLSVQFDKAIPKKGEEVPVILLVMAVAPPQSDYSAGSTPSGSDPMANRGAAAAGGSPMGGSRSQNPTTGTPSYPGADSQNGTTTGTGAQLPANSRGVYGIKDLKLMMHNVNGTQTTVITSTGKNVHLDGGTRLLLVAQGEGTAAAAQNK